MGGSGSAAQTASMSSMSSSGTASAAAAVAGSSSKNGLSSTQLKLIIIIAVVVGLSFALCTLAISWYWRRLASRPGRTWLPRGICCLSRKKQATIEPFLAEPSTPVPEMKGNISPGGNSMLSDASSMSPLLHHTHAVMSDQSNVNTGGHRIPGSMRRDSAMVPADTSSRFRLGDLRVEGSANESQTTTNEPVLWIPIPQRGQQGVIDVNNIAGNPSMTTPASTIPSPTSSSDLLVIPQARHLASILAPDIESPMTPPPMYRERD
ncbi:hypothetical protein CERSUDRAFT_114339 [Gelatoporia subvermispora B]|uniref:Uncharacterized protein n=1 Tax=Ceriporiopsis subvermispora (strain B) TaxID=914234 RepID=M2RGU9_CERS8|nr:hypothetical protein CERSUDRAFT_114339 [Gelatoporia subvermispora B]